MREIILYELKVLLSHFAWESHNPFTEFTEYAIAHVIE